MNALSEEALSIQSGGSSEARSLQQVELQKGRGSKTSRERGGGTVVVVWRGDTSSGAEAGVAFEESMPGYKVARR